MRWTTGFGSAALICATVLSAAAGASQGAVTALPDISDKPIQYILMPAEAGRLTAAQRQFVSAFTSASASTDPDVRKRVIDPSAHACVDAHPEFFAALFTRSARALPREFRVGFVKIEKPDAVRQKVRTMNYARPPTHVMIIEWEQGGGNVRRREVTVVRDLREDASGLRELLMCPTPDVLKQFEASKKTTGRLF